MTPMPQKGKWVRIRLTDPPGALSCAAQVYKRQSYKKAQLIFSEEQDKNSHEEFNASRIDIYLDEEEESNRFLD